MSTYNILQNNEVVATVEAANNYQALMQYNRDFLDRNGFVAPDSGRYKKAYVLEYHGQSYIARTPEGWLRPHKTTKKVDENREYLSRNYFEWFNDGWN